MNLDGKAYVPGDLVPQKLVDSIRPGRFDSMVRLRHLEQVTPSQAVTAHRESTTPSTEGATCPICNGGPYKSLKGHMTKMHKAQEE